MNTIETINPEPFRHLIMTLGELPTSFTESMSYYEMLAWLCDYLKNKVTPAVNNNAEALVELREYVEHYFDTADFQTLVNNKLDEMAEDGTLADIISQYIDVNYVKKTDYATDETAGVVKVGDGLSIDNEGVLSETPFADFIQDIDLKRVRYNGIGGYTNVYYAIIPASNKPTFKLANNHLDNAKVVSDMSYDNKATLATNAGVMDPSTNETWGAIVVDGEFLQGNDHVFASTHEVLYMTEDGKLNILPYSSTEAQIMSVNPVWALVGFYTLINGYQTTEYVVDNTDFAERTVIAQDGDGNYLIFVTEGRSIYSVGFNPQDIVNFATSIGFTSRILYNLDGGGSSQMVYHGVTVNQLAGDTGKTRIVPNTLCWISPTAKNQGVFDEAHTMNDVIIAERRKEVITNLKPLITAGTNVNISNLSIYGEGSIIYLEGNLVTSASIATYGRLAEGMPKPAIANAYVELIKSDTKETYLAYIAGSTGYFNNASIEALPAGTYYIRTWYRIAPNKTLSETLE